MTFEIDATYEGGIFRPDNPVACPDHSRVRLTVEPVGVEAEWAATRQQRLEARGRFQEWCDRVQFHSNGERFTRDELHERD